MPLVNYTLNWSDDTQKAPVALAPTAVNTISSSLTLFGHGAESYGEGLQENMLRIMENFAAAAQPANSTKGQLWYDTSVAKLKIFTGTAYVLVDADLDATLAALAGLDATAGLIEQTGADTFAKVPFSAAARLLLTEQKFSGAFGEKVNSMGLISGAQTIDNTLGTYVVATINGATTFTFTNPISTGYAGGFTLELTNGGSAAITWPASVKWAAGTAATLTAAGTDILVFMTRDGGTTWRGVMVSADSK